MQTLIRILLFFSFFSSGTHPSSHSTVDLYRHTTRIFQLSKDGKSLNVILLCDSVIREYKNFTGSETYLGYIYIYLAEAAKQQGDISLARYSLEIAKGFFRPGSEELDYQIPVNILSVDLEAGQFEKCITQGLILLDQSQFELHPARKGSLLNNLAASALGARKYDLADSLFCCLFDLIHNNIEGEAFDTALTYRNFGRYKLSVHNPEEAIKPIMRSLSLYQLQYGDLHFQTAKSWQCLGNAYRGLNQLDSASYCYMNARKAFTQNDFANDTKASANFSLDYETIVLDLTMDEVNLSRTQALQNSGIHRVNKLVKALEKAAMGINHFETILPVLISSESGFILADKSRKIFNTAIHTSIDLYKETGGLNCLRQAFLWSLQAGSISLQAKASMEEKMSEDDSIMDRTIHLMRIREALNKTIDRDLKSAQLQEYQLLKQQLAFTFTESVLSSDPPEILFKQICMAIGRRYLLCFHQMDSALLVFGLSGRDLSYSEIPITDKFRNTLADFTNSLTNPIIGNYPKGKLSEFCKEGTYLYQILLQPIVSQGNSSDFLIRSDGLIIDLPFEALVIGPPTDNLSVNVQGYRDLPFVIKSYTISYISGIQPSLHRPILRFHRKSMRVLCCQNDIHAPEITNELNYLSIRRFDADLLNMDSAGADIIQSLDRTDIIHFAGHLKTSHGDAMRTIMGCSSNTANAFQLSELLHVRIKSELVFLNACESAEGEFNLGDGNLSPGLFFLLAGAGGVIEHRWKAPDFSCSMVAMAFYTFYRGDQQVKALQKAKLNYLDQCQPGLDHPHYWSGLVYMGPLLIKRTSQLHTITIALIGIGLLVIIGFIIRKGIFH